MAYKVLESNEQNCSVCYLALYFRFREKFRLSLTMQHRLAQNLVDQATLKHVSILQLSLKMLRLYECITFPTLKFYFKMMFETSCVLDIQYHRFGKVLRTTVLFFCQCEGGEAAELLKDPGPVLGGRGWEWRWGWG